MLCPFVCAASFLPSVLYWSVLNSPALRCLTPLYSTVPRLLALFVLHFGRYFILDGYELHEFRGSECATALHVVDLRGSTAHVPVDGGEIRVDHVGGKVFEFRVRLSLTLSSNNPTFRLCRVFDIDSFYTLCIVWAGLYILPCIHCVRQTGPTVTRPFFRFCTNAVLRIFRFH